ncbi:hypothetical protein [Comamonas serinivorans]|nr:hypothetical protein [Comamonas serinivorans]
MQKDLRGAESQYVGLPGFESQPSNPFRAETGEAPIMKTQRGYIDLDGLTSVLAVLAVLGVFGLFSLFYWAIPAAWALLKPWLHTVTG